MEMIAKWLCRQAKRKKFIQMAATAVFHKPWCVREEVGKIISLSSPELDKHNAYNCTALDSSQKGEIQLKLISSLTTNT